MLSLFLKTPTLLFLLMIPLFSLESKTPLCSRFFSTPQKLIHLQNHYENLHLTNLEEKGLPLLHKMEDELTLYKQTCLRWSSYEEQDKNYPPYAKLKQQAGQLRSSLAVYGVFKRHRTELLQKTSFYHLFDWMLHESIPDSFHFKKAIFFSSNESLPDNNFLNTELFYEFVNIQKHIPLILDEAIEKHYDKEDPEFSFANLLEKIYEATFISLKNRQKLIDDIISKDNKNKELQKDLNHDIEVLNSLLTLEDSEGFYQIGPNTPLLHIRYPTQDGHKIHSLYLKKYHALMNKISLLYGLNVKSQIQRIIGNEESEKGIIYTLLTPLSSINSPSYTLHKTLTTESLKNIMTTSLKEYLEKLTDLESKKKSDFFSSKRFKNIEDKKTFLNITFYNDPQSMALLFVMWPWYSVIFSKTIVYAHRSLEK